METATKLYTLKQPIPVIQVSNLERSLQFYVDTFGFENPRPYSEGYGAVERDGMFLHFMVKEKVNPTMVYNYCEGVDSIHDLVRAHGGEIVNTLKDQPYGMREFTALDPDGNFIAFSQAIS